MKVYNIFNCNKKENTNNKGEINNKPSLTDPLDSVPTLQEYINKYVLTGSLNGFVDNGEEMECDDNEEFSPMELRNSDIEDIKDYKDELLNRSKSYFDMEKGVQIRTVEEKQTKNKKVLKDNEASDEASEAKQEAKQNK